MIEAAAKRTRESEGEGEGEWDQGGTADELLLPCPCPCLGPLQSAHHAAAHATMPHYCAAVSPPILGFTDVEFGYPGGPVLFRDLNFG